MLTLDQVEDVQLGQYVQELEGLGEVALRGLLDDATALLKRSPSYLSKGDIQDLAEAALAKLVAIREASAPIEDGVAEPARTLCLDTPLTMIFNFWAAVGQA